MYYYSGCEFREFFIDSEAVEMKLNRIIIHKALGPDVLQGLRPRRPQ